MRTWARHGLLTSAAATLAVAALASCGSEQSFTAQEFVEAVNDEGVTLKLGEPLLSDDPSQELFAVELEPVSSLPGSEGGARTSGSISVSEDSGGADEEMRSCEASADLLCYRAANVVIVLEGGGIEAQQLGVAVERVAEG